MTLIFMKDLSQKVKNSFEIIDNNSLDNELRIILRESTPFTDLDTVTELDEIDSDTEINAGQYFEKLDKILGSLIQRIDQNKSELEDIKKISARYKANSSVIESPGEKAVMSLIFKDLKTTGTLREFSKVLNRWNTTLNIYYSLLKSEAPADISLVEIQNGSIDVIFNFDFDIAIDLTDLIKTGLKVYGTYLLYKSKTAKEIIESFMGNKKLIAKEKEIEKLMLDNIKELISNKILEQHKEKYEVDKNIDVAAPDKRIEFVSSVIADHIIKGNEVKLLTAPPIENENDQNDLPKELREQTALVRARFKGLKQEDKQHLLETFSIKEEEDKGKTKS